MFKHGGNILKIAKENSKSDSDYLDFSANINPLGLDDEIKKTIKDNIDKLIFYPDSSCESLREKISKKYSLKKEQIFIGNGASDLIYKIVWALQIPLKALVTAPTFSEYENAVLSTYMGEVKYYNTAGSFSIKRDFIDYLTNINIIFLCNPNNPDGSIIDMNILEDILEECKKKSIYVVIDESFIDFVKNGERYESIYLIEKYYNLIIIKSFTKIFAFPGLRLAYLVSKNEELLYRLKAISPQWNINLLALAAGEKAIDVYEKIKKDTLEILNEESIYLRKSLKELGFTVYDFYANYIMFKIDKDIDLYEKLLKKGIIIRSCSNFKGLDKNYYRIAIRKHKDNEKLIDELKNLKKEIES